MPVGSRRAIKHASHRRHLAVVVAIEREDAEGGGDIAGPGVGPAAIPLLLPLLMLRNPQQFPPHSAHLPTRTGTPMAAHSPSPSTSESPCGSRSHNVRGLCACGRGGNRPCAAASGVLRVSGTEGAWPYCRSCRRAQRVRPAGRDTSASTKDVTGCASRLAGLPTPGRDDACRSSRPASRVRHA